MPILAKTEVELTQQIEAAIRATAPQLSLGTVADLKWAIFEAIWSDPRAKEVR